MNIFSVMQSRESLTGLFELSPEKEASAFIVYASSCPTRLKFTCNFIFHHVLRVPVEITNNRQRFEGSAAFRINYSGEEFPGVFRIRPQGLLFAIGIEAEKPGAFFNKEMIYFYQILSDQSDLHFDIFSAVFYFISRYEEWQPFQTDRHGRFEAAESLLFGHGFHQQPVVDKWIAEFRLALLNFYPDSRFPAAKFRTISTIDVDNLYAYRAKGLMRTIGASLKDLLKGDFANLRRRFRVLKGREEDPFDRYAEISAYCSNNQVPLFFFFLFRTGTRYDRTVSPASGAFQKVFDLLRENRAVIGLHPSYRAGYKKQMLQEEQRRLSAACGEQVSLSRQHFLRFDIRQTPHFLMESGIRADFTMGFASMPGFRAGTSYPFYHYDLAKESATDLLMVPFCAMDGAYTVYGKTDPAAALLSLLNLAGEIKKTGGNFITVFHERTFSDHLYPGFGTLYKNLLLNLKQF